MKAGKERIKAQRASEVTRLAQGGAEAIRAAASRVPPAVTILAYMRVHGLTQVDLAKRLGCSQSTVSDVLYGEFLPDSRLRRAFEAVCWIPTAHWDKRLT
jgi:ribosome-binding protein aMBF1 (putative translation factor)